jgi:hypothetical protein
MKLILLIQEQTGSNKGSFAVFDLPDSILDLDAAECEKELNLVMREQMEKTKMTLTQPMAFQIVE